MPTIQVEAQVSPEELLKAAQQLPEADLERFAAQVIALRARRHAPFLSASETALLMQINEGLPEPLRSRYELLTVKRDDETLSTKEHAELLRLTDKVERWEVRRVAALTKLAKLRGVSLRALMKQLGIPRSNNA